MIRRKIVTAAGAERRGGLLHLAVELDQHRLHRADDEGEGDEEQRQRRRATCVKAMSMPIGPVVAVEREQRQAGDDRRQRERQVDHRVDDALPRNSSRTRTQAMSVPSHALITTTMSETITVSSAPRPPGRW